MMWRIRDCFQKWAGQPWQPSGKKLVLDD